MLHTSVKSSSILSHHSHRILLSIRAHKVHEKPINIVTVTVGRMITEPYNMTLAQNAKREV